jgi:hypothetical protein
VLRVDSAGATQWPGLSADQLAQAGTWPTEEELLAEQLARHVRVEVSVEVHSNIDDLVEEYTACRLLFIMSVTN